MHSKKKNTLLFMAKVPVLIFYFVFLIVQIQFNLESAPSITNQFSPSHENAVKLVGRNSHHDRNNKTSIRLNKRFEPGHALCCIAITVQVVSFYLDTKQASSSTDDFVSPSYSRTLLLRGPPSVA
jgi:hypothetical protein